MLLKLINLTNHSNCKSHACTHIPVCAGVCGHANSDITMHMLRRRASGATCAALVAVTISAKRRAPSEWRTATVSDNDSENDE